MPGLTPAPTAAAPGPRGDAAKPPGLESEESGAFALLLAPGGANPVHPATPASPRPAAADDAPIAESPDLAGQILAVLDNPLQFHQDTMVPPGAALPAGPASAGGEGTDIASATLAAVLPPATHQTGGSISLPSLAEPGRTAPGDGPTAPASPSGSPPAGPATAVADVRQAALPMPLAVSHAPGDPAGLPVTPTQSKGEDFSADAGGGESTQGSGLERLQAPPPSGGLAHAARAATPPPAVITMPPVPAEGFDDGFAARIGWMAGQGLGRAELHVYPDDVGPIEVRLQLDGNRLHAEFHSANAEVRQALEATMSRLRDLLGQQGLQLAQSHVGQGGSGGRDPARPGQAPSAATGEAAADELAPLAHGGRPLRGLVDEYA